ncbi:hypothetical protein UFOVP712_5 [uncultured Caudovirales phage]|uniref:Uncharacterized protein n=1 Tax=uncultured Caudovirales phage TaxID=2100421 RepID=A0A6J5NMT5_9CAUD|nr:hypothetical protein UFOVP712_5 [uncultured Caudovirales phage]
MAGVEELIAQQVILEGLGGALSVMESMCVNEGQSVTFLNHIIQAFTIETEIALESSVDEGYEWDDVDIGDPYMTFMGEIVEVGNAIMQEAINIANSIENEEGGDGGILETLGDIFDIFFGDGKSDERDEYEIDL